MSLTLYLLRHGRVEGAGTRRYLGVTDAPLDETGRRQAAWWRDRFGPNGPGPDGLEPGGFGRSAFKRSAFWRVLCSDLARSLDTARIITEGSGLEPEPLAALREIDLGAWDGLAMADVRRDSPDLYEARGRDLAGFRPPGGESFRDVLARVAPVVEALVREAGMRGTDGRDHRVLLAGHAGVNRVVLCHVLGLPLCNLMRLGQDHGCLSVVRWGSGGPRLTLLNLPPGPV